MDVDLPEFNTILAALRFWQAFGPPSGNEGAVMDADRGAFLVDLASGGGAHDPMTADAIDALCMRLNCAGA